MTKQAYLYKLTSPSGKCYIGISVDVKKRWGEHKSAAACGLAGALYNAIRKYGWDSFVCEVICESSFEDIKNKEIETIKQLNTFIPNGYNMTRGGDGTLGVLKSEEVIRKISEKQKNRKFTDEHRAKISAALKGRKLPEEIKRKIGEASARVVRTPEWCAKISKAKKGVVPKRFERIQNAA